jgi:TetR/AcrR family transcriptional regulator, mexJK operon transcriptional repressor
MGKSPTDSVPGRPRPLAPRTTSRGVERASRLRDYALERFLAEGFDGVNLNDLIREVGGSKSLIYKHFGSKEGLFVAAVIGMCEQLIGDLTYDGLAGLATEEGLSVLAHRLLAALLTERHIAFQRLVIAESGRFPQVMRAWFNNGPQKSRAVIAGYLKSRFAAGKIKAVDFDRVAIQLHDMITIDLLYRAMLGAPPDPAAIRAAVDSAVETLLHGIA